MKTIRYNTYETNSSSTHAYTVNRLNRSNRPDLNIIPDDRGFIRLRLGEMTCATPQDKISHVLKYANSIGDQDMFDRIRKTVEEFTGGKLLINSMVWKNNNYEEVELREVDNPKFDFDDEDSDFDLLDDEWYSYSSEYGHGSIREFCDVMTEICSSEENLKIFIFSSKQGVEIESYYD